MSAGTIGGAGLQWFQYTFPVPELTNQRDALLLLTLAKGWGPVLIRRAIAALGSPTNVLGASAAALEEHVEGVGVKRAAAMLGAVNHTRDALQRELDLAHAQGVQIVTIMDEGAYPPLLAPLDDAPPVLYFKGALTPSLDRYCVGIVGSRKASAYGVEQAERFSGFLADAGLCVVSGGARGIDTAAHRAALRAKGRTVVVAGAGLTHTYPPDNVDLFAHVADEGGAVISEFAMTVAPAVENFPRRNRIISGMSLGVLVVEAPTRSGALITARLAAEEQGREVMAIPGRIDAPGSAGCNRLIRTGGAALVASPADVLEMLEQPARHAHLGTHAARTAQLDPSDAPVASDNLFGRSARESNDISPFISMYDQEFSLIELNLTQVQKQLLDALASPRTIDEVLRDTGLPPAVVQAETTILEIRRLIARDGDQLRRRARAPQE